MNSPADITGVLIDIDDTLIDWVKPHAQAYAEISKALSKMTQIREAEIISDIKDVHTKHQTIEYSALIQSMHSFQNLSEKQQNELIAIVQTILSEKTSNYPSSFPGVKVLLERLKINKKARIAISDAPKHKAYLRIKRAGLVRKYIDTLIARPSPSDKLFRPEHQMEKKDFKIPVIESNQPKPYTELERILHFTSQQIRSKYFVIGNSESSDVGLAKRYGLLCYQTHWDQSSPEDLAILKQYAPDLAHSGDNIVAHPGFDLVEVSSPQEIIEDLIKRGIIQ